MDNDLTEVRAALAHVSQEAADLEGFAVDLGVKLKETEAERDALKAALEDQRKARQTAAGAADRFRDVLSEALGYPDENPGDDVLVATLRKHFGKTGPEPTRWRDFLTAAGAIKDQINAAALDHPTDTARTPADSHGQRILPLADPNDPRVPVILDMLKKSAFMGGNFTLDSRRILGALDAWDAEGRPARNVKDFPAANYRRTEQDGGIPNDAITPNDPKRGI